MNKRFTHIKKKYSFGHWLRRGFAVAAMLLAGGSAGAQGSDSPYVIKVKGSNHYLAHVKVGDTYVLQDATSFSPDCIWYSGIEQNITGTTHNYYFIDDESQYRFLMAPLQASGTLGLSSSLPPTYQLSNTDLEYYFYDWDQDNRPDGGGVARGHQHPAASEGECSYNWEYGECWQVYWITYKDGWRLTSTSYYNASDVVAEDDGTIGRFRKVTATEYITPASGGLSDLSNYSMTYNTSQALSAAVTTPYTYYSYTHYSFTEDAASDHYYYDAADHTAAPASANGSDATVSKYEWTLSGPGASYLSFASESDLNTIEGETPTLYYRVENLTGNKTATLTLTVTYPSGVTQEKSATVTVQTTCQNPALAAAPKVDYNDVTVSWYNIAQGYKLYWKKTADADWEEREIEPSGSEVMSHTLPGLAATTEYQYKIQAKCGETWSDATPTTYTFTTGQAAELMIYGSVFGGGRMANVTGNTEVVIVNSDSIGAVYGGNDIAGAVQGSGGSTIVLGVDASDANATAYNSGNASTWVRIHDVYGGGNGYYLYDAESFAAATVSNKNMGDGTSVKTIGGQTVWTNETGDNYALTIPTIVKTSITATNNTVKVDSLFGGAKNAFITNSDANANGTSITVNGGTVNAVFGGNNWGGTQTDGKHHIAVNGTTTKATVNDYNSYQLGRDFGIGYLFGGGNKVVGKTTDVSITGGQCDTVFAGGNAASVAGANVTMNCVGSSKTFSAAVSSWSGDNVSTIDGSYLWNGTGIYNVRALFGGNNQAAMTVVPTITLTAGGAGTVYGGGNAGDMNGEVTTSGIATDFGALEIESTTYDIYHGTHVVMNSANMLVDYLYGGCQMSDVYRSTWVEMSAGHVGTVYGGCNISGDVGSRYLFNDAYTYSPRHEKYQAVKGATFVKVSGGHIYNDLFAGSNGRYHCNDGRNYVAGINYEDAEERYVGMTIPSHNETHLLLTGGEVGGSVYAGGNLACVGFINESTPLRFFSGGYTTTPVFVGLATVRMTGGTVHGNVFGGGNMASIWGSNAVMVEGGTINGALYGGNDRIGLVAQITNRVLSDSYDKASDGITPLDDVRTYVSVTGRPQVNTVYGGGNGDYDYSAGQYCNPNDQPVQSYTFVDININGSADGLTPAGHINTVYGGGNGVTVTGSTTVFMNVVSPDASDHVDVIYGGNNKGHLDILPDIILLHGNVGTVYGGCNQGAMTGDHTVTLGGETYEHVGSRVHLHSSYDGDGDGGSSPVTPDAVVTKAVYGGCRMNGVDNNSLVLVEGGSHPDASLFGGSDISGTVSGTSRVVVTGGQTGNIYGGGNGDYDYDGHNVYEAGQTHDAAHLVASGDADVTAPVCANSRVDILGGQVGASGSGNTRDVFGGGLGHLSSTSGDVVVNVGDATHSPTIYGDVYGGSALGSVNTSNSNTTTVNILNGTLNGDIYGGGLGSAPVAAVGTEGDPGYVPAVAGVAATVNGVVTVNIGATDGEPTPTYSGSATLGGNVYGCNNTYGSPMDDVYVNIFKTAHGADAAHNLYPSAPGGGWNVTTLATNSATQTYAIDKVFGGGNLAAYQPSVAGKKATVHVYACDNTIEDVFGGGNAADVGTGTVSGEVTTRTDTYVIIEGGRIKRLIGGGNGEDLLKPAANIFGTANTTVYAGLIDEVYGGANVQGSVDAINLVMSNPSHSSLSSCSDQVYGKVFGCANAADYNRSVTTTIECGVGEIGELYGGSNLADIGTEGQYNADVTLNLYGGTHTQVFAGSKGDLSSLGGGHIDKPSNIYGNVTLNLYGGTVTDAYGGSNYNGNIAGIITVNVLDVEGTCPLDVTNVYGASNLAAYTPTFTPASGTEKVSPVVNVIHIAQTPGVRGNVFGGGNHASVTASPQVNIGYYDDDMSGEIPDGYPIAEANRRGYVSGNIYGGGNEAGVTGNPVINMRDKGTVVSGIYGGCNTNGTVDGDINVNIYGGTLGTNLADMTEGIFGGGKGSSTQTTGDVTVTIGDGSTPTVYADVYGGSAFGQVGATGKTAKVDLKAGTVNGTIFGGGMGDATYTAEVTGNTEVAIAGNVTDGVYGGCNVKGIVKGNSVVEVTGGTVGDAENASRGIVYGGGLGENTKVNGDVEVTVNAASGDIYGDVYGGSAKGLVNCNEAGTAVNAGSTTTVTLTGGTIHGNLYGGGHGPTGEDAHVWGPVTVNVGGGTVAAVFGGNNQSGTPQSTIQVNVSGGTMTNVVGGGNVAAYTAPAAPDHDYPYINISGGTVTGRVIGGGNAANVNGNPRVTVSDGVIGTAGDGRGIYGGCNASGTVTGNTTVTLTGGTIGAEGSGNGANIHGGGYGQSTSVTGNVTVNYGEHNFVHSAYPLLYGDLYGGSALGNVNTGSTNTTTVNVLNGTIVGGVYGGGLGQKSPTVEATVNGKVYVNIGLDGGYGLATLSECSVYGCNNVKGSPQSDVYVHVWQTDHTLTNTATYFDADRTYAIAQLFGGGNAANYAPDGGNENSECKTTVWIHGCDNTVSSVYGGGNAADAVGVFTLIEGGRLYEIYGGGNGREVPANVGKGGISLGVLAGNVGFMFQGSNKHGNNYGTFTELKGGYSTSCPGGLFVDSYFFGANEAEIYGDISSTISCADAGSFEYRYVYAGSRWGIVYGDISLTVKGGTIENLFGGCQGEVGFVADVRKFPTFAEIDAYLEEYPDTNGKYSPGLLKHMGYKGTTPREEPSYAGHGGNVNLVVNGGTIGNVFGGCDYLGNVEGTITVIINNAGDDACPLFVGNVYGGCNRAPQEPLDNSISTPDVMVLNATVGGTHQDLPVNNINGVVPTTYAGNVFGGGNYGNITADPKVIIGDGPSANVTIRGSVYGGGNEGDIIGSPKVVIVPKTHTLTINTPGNSNQLVVTDSKDDAVSSGTAVGEDIILSLEAKPAIGQSFTSWTVTGTGSSVESTTDAVTTFTMGTADATITANFTPATSHTLTISTPSGGTASVKDVQGNAVASGSSVGEGTVLYLAATPDVSHSFTSWSATGGGASVAKDDAAVTTFTMGTENATLSASFAAATTHNFTYSATNGTVTVKDASDGSVSSGASIGVGTVLSITAAPSDGYSFSGWTATSGTVLNPNATSTSFTMGNADAALTATFATSRTLTVTAPSHGNIKVTDGMAHAVTSGDPVGEGAELNLKATPEAGYAFKQWTVTGTGAAITASNSPITTMTMGTADATLAAEFVTAHAVTITPAENGVVKVTNALGFTVTSGNSVGEGAVLTLKATAGEGYTFGSWTVTGTGATVDDASAAETTVTVGTGPVTITATFNEN